MFEKHAHSDAIQKKKQNAHRPIFDVPPTTTDFTHINRKNYELFKTYENRIEQCCAPHIF